MRQHLAQQRRQSSRLCHVPSMMCASSAVKPRVYRRGRAAPCAAGRGGPAGGTHAHKMIRLGTASSLEPKQEAGQHLAQQGGEGQQVVVVNPHVVVLHVDVLHHLVRELLHTRTHTIRCSVCRLLHMCTPTVRCAVCKLLHSRAHTVRCSAPRGCSKLCKTSRSLGSLYPAFIFTVSH